MLVRYDFFFTYLHGTPERVNCYKSLFTDDAKYLRKMYASTKTVKRCRTISTMHRNGTSNGKCNLIL